MNIRKLSLGIIALSLVAFTSCKDEEKQEATPAQSQVNTTTNNNSNTTASLNPAHGEPGHRCDIPVGADLNQAASGNVQMQQNNTVNPNVSPVRMNSSATPAKNPPHGQPGHDCSKPVGADL